MTYLRINGCGEYLHQRSRRTHDDSSLYQIPKKHERTIKRGTIEVFSPCIRCCCCRWKHVLPHGELPLHHGCRGIKHINSTHSINSSHSSFDSAWPSFLGKGSAFPGTLTDSISAKMPKMVVWLECRAYKILTSGDFLWIADERWVSINGWRAICVSGHSFTPTWK